MADGGGEGGRPGAPNGDGPGGQQAMSGGGFPVGMPGQFPPGGYPGYPMGPNSYGGYGQYPGYGGYGGYGMYPNVYQMFPGYSMYPQAGGGGYFPQGVGGFPGPGGQPPPPLSDGPDSRERSGVPANPSNMMPGDWLCPRCGDHVFARNRACRRCATPKPEGAGDIGGCSSFADRGLRPAGGLSGGNNQRSLPGDWNCPKCKDLQFARNKQCRMCGCPKPEGGTSDNRDDMTSRNAYRRSRSRSRSKSRRR
mmetsp:Transcript_25610/g.76381  ORF Transcript_25610/g.76381 Transcript_25610/m.76381 type:complete len:251 (+) Transcript_25610:99-851(+)